MKQIVKFGIAQTAKVVGVFYFIIAMVFCIPFGVIMVIANGKQRGMGIFLIFAPIIYGIGSYVFAAISAWIYNLIAQKFGGIEIQVESARLAESEKPLGASTEG